MNKIFYCILSFLITIQYPNFVYANEKKVELKKTAPRLVNSKKDEELKLEPDNSITTKEEILNSSASRNESLFLDSLDYPELQVVPRASERIQMDAYREQHNGWFMFWPFHVASGATLIAALLHKNRFNDAKADDESFRRNSDFKVNAAAGISVSWFALTYFISANQPYSSVLSKINQIKGRDKKSQLLKERLAEEAMQKPAELVKMLSYLSTITNLAAAGGLMDIVNSDYNMYAGVAMLTSFMPLIFKNKYVENYEKQMEYKRKIYAPVVYTDFYKPNQYAQWSPRLVMQWNF